jgi:hypothetical protein
MTATNRTSSRRDAAAECLAAELTEAAYPVVFRHGVNGSSVDLELDLWKALTEKLQARRREAPPLLGEDC